MNKQDCRWEDCENQKAPGRSLCWKHYTEVRKGKKSCTPVAYTTKPTTCRTLFLDIETRPSLAYVWDLWDQNIGINQIVEAGEMFSFSAKWLHDSGEDSVMYFDSRQDKESMVRAAWELMDACDVLVTYYGTKFDRKHLNTEFIKHGFPPPSPSKDVDLKLIVAKRFKFPSNKLQYVSTALGLPGKIDHEGFDLWRRCMENDDEAWEKMCEYNKQDTVLLEELYNILLPWIPNLPNKNLYDGFGSCPACCSTMKMIDAGFYHTKMSKYPQFQCPHCKSFFRSSRRIEGMEIQGVTW